MQLKVTVNGVVYDVDVEVEEEPKPALGAIFMAGGVKTLPIWIFQSFRLANQVPLVNVAGLVAILLSVIPVYFATRLSGGVVGARG